MFTIRNLKLIISIKRRLCWTSSPELSLPTLHLSSVENLRANRIGGPPLPLVESTQGDGRTRFRLPRLARVLHYSVHLPPTAITTDQERNPVETISPPLRPLLPCLTLLYHLPASVDSFISSSDSLTFRRNLSRFSSLYFSSYASQRLLQHSS